MFGNCATGKVRDCNCADNHHQDCDDHRHDGPFDKEFGHDSFPLRVEGLNGRRSLDVALEGFRLHRHSWPEILLAFDDHAFTGMESTLDDPHRVSALSRLAPGAC